MRTDVSTADITRAIKLIQEESDRRLVAVLALKIRIGGCEPLLLKSLDRVHRISQPPITCAQPALGIDSIQRRIPA